MELKLKKSIRNKMPGNLNFKSKKMNLSKSFKSSVGAPPKLRIK